MLCTRCAISKEIRPKLAPGFPVSRPQHEWARLGRLICEQCGGILPVGQPRPDAQAKALQLARFGLSTDGDTLLEP
jgi:hypothetical protein